VRSPCELQTDIKVRPACLVIESSKSSDIKSSEIHQKLTNVKSSNLDLCSSSRTQVSGDNRSNQTSDEMQIDSENE